MADVSTAEGRKRVAVVRPPKDSWGLLPRDHRLPPGADVFAYLWWLLVAVYGLKDAPRLWVLALSRILIGAGWVVSRFDEQVFYLRREGMLIGMLSAHVDDLALTGESGVISKTHALMQKE